MSFDTWLPNAADRLCEAARVAKEKPELKEKSESFLCDLEHSARECEIHRICHLLETENPVADIVSLDDLSNTLERAYWDSHIKQRDKFRDGYWLKELAKMDMMESRFPDKEDFF